MLLIRVANRLKLLINHSVFLHPGENQPWDVNWFGTGKVIVCQEELQILCAKCDSLVHVGMDLKGPIGVKPNSNNEVTSLEVMKDVFEELYLDLKEILTPISNSTDLKFEREAFSLFLQEHFILIPVDGDGNCFFRFIFFFVFILSNTKSFLFI